MALCYSAIRVRYLLRETRPSGAAHKRYLTLIFRAMLNGAEHIAAVRVRNLKRLARVQLFLWITSNGHDDWNGFSVRATSGRKIAIFQNLSPSID